ncbi:MAG: DUF2007 domain-containing protein [Solirubrobacterales bacterium]
MDLVEVAFARDATEAGLIEGLLENVGIASMRQQVGVDGPRLGYGILNPGGGAMRLMVRADRAEEARTLLAETFSEAEEEFPDPANTGYLADATSGRRPRGYGLLGAYARIWAWGFGAMLAAFALFLLLRAA